jgi:hypothetical protein
VQCLTLGYDKNSKVHVSEVFNDFFINVAKNIGNTNVIVNKEHPSVCMIKENKLITDDLNFKPVSSDLKHLLVFSSDICRPFSVETISESIFLCSHQIYVGLFQLSIKRNEHLKTCWLACCTYVLHGITSSTSPALTCRAIIQFAITEFLQTFQEW